MPAVSDDATPGAEVPSAPAPASALPGGAPLPGPLIFGDYELLSEIARGGMGVVYRARQRKLNRIVALKLILAGQFAGEAEIKRFRAEAEAVANLDHPHIVPVFEVGEFEGRHFFSMKLIEGRSLAEGRPADALGVDDRVRLMLKVAQAIHYAHQRGVLHRDLKPANILLDRQGEPHVTDFGLARRLGAESRLTMTGTIFGTPAYMPPEQADDARSLTVAADVYSLGAALYDLLAGRPPFEAPTPVETVMLLRDQEPRPLRAFRPEIAKDLETICLKCLRKDPAQRYGSALALAEDLQRYLADEPVMARRVGLPERVWRWARRRPGVATLAGAVFLLLVGLAVGGAVMTSRLSKAVKQANLSLQEQQNELWATDLSRAELERVGLEAGHKEFGLRALAAAAAIRPDAGLLDEAVAQFALFDCSGQSTKHPRSARGMSVAITPDFSTYLIAETNLAITAHRAADHAVLWRLALSKPPPINATVSLAERVDRRTSRIEYVYLSPDGATAAVNLTDERLEILDIAGRRSVTNYPDLAAVQFSPDSRQLLVVDRHRQPVVLNLATGNPIVEPAMPNHQQGEMVFHPDPTVPVLAMARFGTVEFWDRKMGRVISHLEHGSEITTLAWSGDLLAAGDVVGDIRVWNLRTARTVLLKGHHGTVMDMLFTPGARQLLSNGRDGRTYCWDPQTGDRLLSSEKFHALQVSADGHQLLYGDEDQWGVTPVLLPRGLRRINCPDLKHKLLRQVAFSRDSRLLMVVRQSGLHFFDAASGEPVCFHPLFPAVRAWFLPGGRTVLAQDHDSIFWFDIVANNGLMSLREQKRQKLDAVQWLEPGSLSADGTVLTLCTVAGTNLLLDTATGRELGRFEDKDAARADFSPASRWVVTGRFNDDPMRAFPLGRPEEAIDLDLSHATPVISPDGRWVVGSSAREHRLSRLEPGGSAHVFAGGGSEFRSTSVATWSPDGKVVALVTQRGEIDLRHAGNWDHLLRLTSPQPASLTGLAFSPDQHYLAAATGDEQIELWDFEEIRDEIKSLQLGLSEPCFHPGDDPTAPPPAFRPLRLAPALPPVIAGLPTYAPRPPEATLRQIDLGDRYNLELVVNDPFAVADGNFMGELPVGLNEFGGIRFDVRGVVQLRGLNSAKRHPEYPLTVPGIRAGIHARRLHFLGGLHDLFRAFPFGTPVGSCVVHFTDGRTAEFPWRAWQDFDDEWFNPRSARDNTPSNVVWTGMDRAAEAANSRVRLMMATWENPWPDAEIATLDLRSENQSPAPFIVAITAE